MLRRTIAVIYLAILVCALLAGPGSTARKPGGTLELLCAPALRSPIEDMLATYEKQTGVRTQVSFGGSNIILGQLRLRSHGDVFIPADRFYTDEATKRGLVRERRIFAYLVPVIMVQRGNRCGIRELTDLLRREIRVGLVDERTAAIGKVSAAVLKKNRIDVDKMNVVYRATVVDELANAIKLKSVDAAIVWKPVAMLYPKDGEIINIPSDKNIVAPVSAAIISSSSNKPTARRFLNYLTSKAGKAILARYHYPTTDPSKVRTR